MANTIEEKFEVRSFGRPIYVSKVDSASDREGDIVVGAEVVLQPVGYDRGEEVYVRVSAIDTDGAITGTIDRANRLGARGQQEFEKGGTVKFSAKNVIRLSN